MPEDAEDASVYDYLLSRYCEGDPEDDNALYEALQALRQAHMPIEDAKDVDIHATMAEKGERKERFARG